MCKMRMGRSLKAYAAYTCIITKAETGCNKASVLKLMADIFNIKNTREKIPRVSGNANSGINTG